MLFGFISALGGALLTLVLFFAGFHSDVAKLRIAQWVGGLGGVAIAVTCTALGTKAVREEVPEAEDFGYGAALWAGVRISAVSSFLIAVFLYFYYAVINPGFADIVVQDKLAKLEAKGASATALDQTEKISRAFLHPLPASIFALIRGLIFGVVISLIVAIFLKRQAAVPPRI